MATTYPVSSSPIGRPAGIQRCRILSRATRTATRYSSLVGQSPATSDCIFARISMQDGNLTWTGSVQQPFMYGQYAWPPHLKYAQGPPQGGQSRTRTIVRDAGRGRPQRSRNASARSSSQLSSNLRINLSAQAPPSSNRNARILSE